MRQKELKFSLYKKKIKLEYINEKTFDIKNIFKEEKIGCHGRKNFLLMNFFSYFCF